MKPTPEQRKVIETENQTLIVEAGAGTGKTWALVGRFIDLLEVHPDWPLEMHDCHYLHRQSSARDALTSTYCH